MSFTRLCTTMITSPLSVLSATSLRKR